MPRFTGMPGWLQSALMTVLSVGLVMAIWQLVAIWTNVPLWLVPRPSDFLARLVTDFPLILRNALATSQMLLIGFALAIAIAVPLALLIVSFDFLQRGLLPVIIFLNIMPKTVIGPILIVWFGISPTVAVLIVFLMSFFPVLVDSMSGFKAIDPRLYYITRSVGATNGQTFWLLRLPAAMSHIFAGMKIGVVKAVDGVVIAEFIASTIGLGHLIMRASSFMDVTLMFSGIVAVAIVALIFNSGVSLLEYLFMPWTRRSE